jgi:hypothetical protein
MVMFEFFKFHIPELQKDLGEGSCGPMGPDREILLP